MVLMALGVIVSLNPLASSGTALSDFVCAAAPWVLLGLGLALGLAGFSQPKEQ